MIDAGFLKASTIVLAFLVHQFQETLLKLLFHLLQGFYGWRLLISAFRHFRTDDTLQLVQLIVDERLAKLLPHVNATESIVRHDNAVPII